MGLSATVLIAGHDEVQASVAVAVDVQGFCQRKHLRAIRGSVENGVETPVPASPRLHLGILLQRFLIAPKNVLRVPKILGVHPRNGAAQHIALQHGARFEQLHNFFGRERGNHGAAIGYQRDQALGRQMAQRFTDGNATYLKLGSNGVLAKLLTLAQFAAQDLFSEPLDDCGSKRLPRNR